MRILTYAFLCLAPTLAAQTPLRYTITTLAGTGSVGYFGDGSSATEAQLKAPYGVTVTAAGIVLIGDQGNSRVRQIAADGTISTIAGTGTSGYSGHSAAATSATLASSSGLVVDSAGAVYEDLPT
jgi:hypothetical protein